MECRNQSDSTDMERNMLSAAGDVFVKSDIGCVIFAIGLMLIGLALGGGKKK